MEEEKNDSNKYITEEEYGYMKKKWIYKTVAMIIIVAVLVGVLTGSITYYVTYGKTLGNLKNSTSNVKSSDENETTKAMDVIDDISNALVAFAQYIDQNYIGDINKNKIIDETIRGFVEGIGDEYSQYMTAEEWTEYQADALGNYVGVGIYMSQDDDGNIVVVSTIKGTPAEEAGIESEDIITAVDGESMIGKTTAEVSSKVKGEEGTQVTLTIYRNGEYIDFTMTRASVKVYHVDSKMLEDNIGYISLLTFDEGCAEEFEQEMDKLIEQGTTKIIFDLRYNTGGLVNEALQILDLFLDKNQVTLITKDANGNEKVNKAENSKKYDVELVILVNEYSASASEIVTGALKDHGVAKVIGTVTYGKGVIQEIIPLNDGGVLKLTTSEYYTPNNVKINKIGITPDYEIEISKEDSENKIDTQLEKAKEILKGE